MTAGEILFQLQQDQLRHDELAHRDILCLPIQNRVKHMVLHFAKYSGRLAVALQEHDQELFTRTVVDIWIIALASANMLNLLLSRELKAEVTYHKTLDSLGETIVASQFQSLLDPNQLGFVELAKITGRMAKACESLDHLESFDFRASLTQGIIEIARLTLAIASLLKINLVPLVHERWKEVERKSIFYRPSEN